MSRCTCQCVPNPECSYDHASENERIDALRRELASLPKFVAEAIQCIDTDALALSFVRYCESTQGRNQRAEFGYMAGSHIASANKTYMEHCVSNFAETRLCDMGNESAILTTLIGRYR